MTSGIGLFAKRKRGKTQFRLDIRFKSGFSTILDQIPSGFSHPARDLRDLRFQETVTRLCIHANHAQMRACPAGGTV